MTNQDLWKALDNYISSSPKQIPDLIYQGTQQKLSILVVVDKSGVLQAIETHNMTFLFCVSAESSPVPDGCRIDKVELDGLFFQLIDCGYNGLAFENEKNSKMVCLDWKDFMVKGIGFSGVRKAGGKKIEDSY